MLADEAMVVLGARFEGMYSRMGRPSIPPEHLLRALLLQMLYTIRSERMLVEQMEYNLLFRWFVGLGMNERVWDACVSDRNTVPRWPDPLPGGGGGPGLG
jgi:transposase